MNIFNEAGALAVSTRLQRLADRFRKEAVQVYNTNGIDFEPKWFPLIYTLVRKSPMSVSELSDEIGYAHPSTISLLKELAKEGLVDSTKDAGDERKRLVALSEKARELVEKMEPVWDKMKRTAEAITDNANNLMAAIDEAEYELNKEGFFDRYQQLVQNELNAAVSIVEYRSEYARAFYDLNYAWISETYEVEPEDEKTLSDPEKYYLKDGGAILIALYHGEPVGTCALRRVGADVMEMSKMTVSKTMRGKKIGELLGASVINKARELGARKMVLYSNKKGSAAGINLYRKLGFEEVPLVGQDFKRADIKMELHFDYAQ